MSRIKKVFFLLPFLFIAFCMKEKAIPFDGYYAVKQKMIAENRDAVKLEISDKEKQLDALINRYAREYIRGNKNSSVLFYDLKKKIEKSKLFSIIRQMPKGANLHIHATAALPAEKLYDLAAQTENTYVFVTEGIKQGTVNIFKEDKVPEGYVPFKKAWKHGLSKKRLIALWTFDNTDTHEGLWSNVGNFLSKTNDFFNSNPDVFKAYYKAVFQDSIEDHIDHLELRIRFPAFKESKAVSSAEILKQAYLEFKKEHPDFSLKIIYSVPKRKKEKPSRIIKEYKNMLSLKQQIKDDYDPAGPLDFIVGFDLSGREDALLDLGDFVPYFKKLYDQGYARDLYLHAGETFLPYSDGIFDAYLLGAKRVGHGLNLYRYPVLLDDFIKTPVPLEVCPISNQLLGYVKDFRMHPALGYLRRGLPVVLGSDDPSVFGNNGLSYDFFVATVYWGLSLKEVKQIALDSIRYSAASDDEKEKMTQRFHEKWNAFVERILAEHKPN